MKIDLHVDTDNLPDDVIVIERSKGPQGWGDPTQGSTDRSATRGAQAAGPGYRLRGPRASRRALHVNRL